MSCEINPTSSRYCEMASNLFIATWIRHTNNCFMTVTEQWKSITCVRFRLCYILENHWYRSLQGCQNERTVYNISSLSDYIWVWFTRTGRMLRWITWVQSYLMLFYIKNQLLKPFILFNLCLNIFKYIFTISETLESVVMVIVSLEISVRVNKIIQKFY